MWIFFLIICKVKSDLYAYFENNICTCYDKWCDKDHVCKKLKPNHHHHFRKYVVPHFLMAFDVESVVIIPVPKGLRHVNSFNDMLQLFA